MIVRQVTVAGWAPAKRHRLSAAVDDAYRKGSTLKSSPSSGRVGGAFGTDHNSSEKRDRIAATRLDLRSMDRVSGESKKTG